MPWVHRGDLCFALYRRQYDVRLFFTGLPGGFLLLDFMFQRLYRPKHNNSTSTHKAGCCYISVFKGLTAYYFFRICFKTLRGNWRIRGRQILLIQGHHILLLKRRFAPVSFQSFFTKGSIMEPRSMESLPKRSLISSVAASIFERASLCLKALSPSSIFN